MTIANLRQREDAKRPDQAKKLTPQEVAAILNQLSIRDSQHKASTIRVRGKHVPIAKVIRHRKRNPLRLRTELSRLRSSMPPGVEVYTPLASPVSTPSILRLPEEITKYIRDYILGAFEKKIWVSQGVSRYLKAQQKNNNLDNFCSSTKTALSLFTHGRSNEAEHILSRAHDGLEDTIKAQCDELIYVFISCIYDYAQSDKLELIMQTIERFSETVTRVLNSTHPIALVCNRVYSYLRKVERGALLAAIERIWESEADGFERALGPLHASTLTRRLSFISDVVLNHDSERGILKLYEIKSACDKDCRSPDDTRFLRACVRLAEALCDRQYPGITDIVAEIMERTQQPGFPSKSASFFQMRAQCYMGKYRMKLREVDAGESFLREAINISVMRYGPRGARTLQIQSCLEQQLRRWGRTAAADEIGR